MNPRTEADAAHWRGRAVISRGGERIGTVEEIYVDERTGRPAWLAVSTGLLGTKLAFIPMADAESTDSGVRVPYHRTDIRTVSSPGPDGVLSVEEESALYRHYGLEDPDAVPAAGPMPAADPVGEPARPPAPVSPPERAGDDGMTRSEEELRVGTTEREAGRVRLRKHVVTEHVTTTVPVRREELRLEREPITEADAGVGADAAISEEEQEVVLHEEEVVVDKRVVPKERVRLGKKTVTERQTVSEDVRKERIDTEGTDAP